ncbi:hypothetical protein [Paramuribaculum intestinale]|jgi:hypothetical protein|uniref:hypothetical protein n=1 Tax=Paramuribaculum intestinale TaxID=2094151 RepID=UPI0025B101D2|nr:hypothetical protein [Paramuribaculum intestinale]
MGDIDTGYRIIGMPGILDGSSGDFGISGRSDVADKMDILCYNKKGIVCRYGI